LAERYVDLHLAVELVLPAQRGFKPPDLAPLCADGLAALDDSSERLPGPRRDPQRAGLHVPEKHVLI
jgi:hypothetical protein